MMALAEKIQIASGTQILTVNPGEHMTLIYETDSVPTDLDTRWEIDVQEDASLSVVWIEKDLRIRHQDSVKIKMGKGALFTGFWLNQNVDQVERRIQVDVLGIHSHAKLYGFTALESTQTSVTRTILNHYVPYTEATQLFKSILDDQSQVSFEGLVFVTPDAQKTDSNQYNQSLVLSDHARVITQPQLKIFADDVKCSHGATIGQLDAEQLLYLESRGLSPQEARLILLHGFYEDIMDRVSDKLLRDELRKHLK